jgi:predicted ATPase
MIRRGWALAMQGSAEEGIMELHKGLATWQSIRTEIGRLQHLVMLAEAYSKGGQAEEGLHVLDEAFAVLHKNAERDYEAELYRIKGELLLQQAMAKEIYTAPLRAEAETYFHKALNVARHQGATSIELRAAMSLSRLWQKEGKREEPRKMLTEIYGWFTEGFNTPDIQEAKSLLEALK